MGGEGDGWKVSTRDRNLVNIAYPSQPASEGFTFPGGTGSSGVVIQFRSERRVSKWRGLSYHPLNLDINTQFMERSR